MPGKHAPPSSKSFLVSLASAVGGALAAIGLVVGVVVVAVNSGNSGKNAAGNPVVRRPTTPSPTPAAPTPTPTTVEQGAPVLPKSRVTLAVLNGTPRTGLARSFRGRATEAGYPVVRVGNAAPHSKSTIYYRADARAEALEFQRVFRELTVVAEAPKSLSGDVLLTIVLGADYSS